MKHEDAERLAEALNRAEVAEAEVGRLRAIVNSQKRVGREGPFTAKRSIGRHANALLARAVLAEERLAKVAALFSGGPDTSCRTTWIDNPMIPGCSAASIECVQVPLADLRAVLASAPEGGES